VKRPVVYIALSEFCRGDDKARRLLLNAGFEVRENASGRRLRGEELLDALQGAEAVIAGVEPYSADLLRALPKLRCISRCGVGTDNIDMEAARKLKIAVLNTTDEVVEAVAQMTVTMILALARNIPLHAADFRAGQWRKYSGYLLSEWTVGLVGFGRIGRAVEQYLCGFGPRIIVTDPIVRAEELPRGVKLLDLYILLAEVDVVSLHPNRRPEEGFLIGHRELQAMKRGSRLVNTARGYLVDQAALLEALNSGHLAAAALDVFDEEPYIGPLATLPQVLCTPHVASLTRASRSAMELRCAENVRMFFSHTS
jgi:D-3-phosphoglycerate dehydrogenase